MRLSESFINKKRVFYFLILACTFLTVVWKMLWIAVIVLMIFFCYAIIFHLIKFIKNAVLQKGLRGLLSFLSIFICIISLRLLIFDIYKIPSSSMEGSLFPNDVILVNKLKYGPKLPRSPFEIPWVNIAFYFNSNAKKRINENWWSYKRLSGSTTIKNGDVFVFNMFGNNTTIVKRCMGIAGDVLEIKNGAVFVNDTLYSPSDQIQNKYVAKVNNINTFSKVLDSLELSPVKKRGDEKDVFFLNLSLKNKQTLEKKNIIKNTEIKIDTVLAFPHSKYNTWTIDNYGPFVIPKKGMTINLTPVNFALYNSVIKSHENIEIEETTDGYFANEKEVTSYTFTQDYYFMMGDNRKGSEDSRFWGVVPENRVVGKVQCVLYSNYKDKFTWSRLFKTVK